MGVRGLACLSGKISFRPSLEWFMMHALGRSTYVQQGTQGTIFAANSGSNKTGVIRRLISVANTMQKLYFPEYTGTVLAVEDDAVGLEQVAAGKDDKQEAGVDAPAEPRFFANKVRPLCMLCTFFRTDFRSLYVWVADQPTSSDASIG